MSDEPRLVMATAKAPDGSVESEGVFVTDDGTTLVLRLPDGVVLEIDDVEFAAARRAA